MARNNTGNSTLTNIRPNLKARPRISLPMNLSGETVTTINSTPSPQRIWKTSGEDMGPSIMSRPAGAIEDKGTPLSTFPRPQQVTTSVKPKPPDILKVKKPSISQFFQFQVPGPPCLPKPSQSTSFKPSPPPAPQNPSFIEHCGADLQASIKSTTNRPPSMHKPEFVGNSLTSGPFGKLNPFVFQKENTDPSLPKMKTLSPVFILGDTPGKPPRPPGVDIGKFKKNGALLNEGYPAQKTKADFKNEDLDKTWTDQQRILEHKKTEKTIVTKIQEELSDEMYEDIEECWPQQQEVKETSSTKVMEREENKSTKDIKKQLEEEKKAQKAKEKREQEAKKKFKIKGEIQIIQKGIARLDYKGGKTDLPLRQGETIEIVRIVDNPGGRWLGRNTEGYYGYVKTESVNVSTEVYDDGVCGGVKSHTGIDGEIYNDVLPLDKRISFPLPATDGEEVYDEIESQSLPSPPTALELIPKEPLDPKKKKRFDKEEKEFRKKFKFEGEIQVLDAVTIVTTLATKKWGNKDLRLKPGEVIDVIVRPVDGRLIGRNCEGKFGYVAMENVAQSEGEIYDDIGEECIYDND